MNIQVGATDIEIESTGGLFRSLGEIRVNGTALRNPQALFRPWFDSFEGEVFDRLEVIGTETEIGTTRLKLKATSNNDYPFRERRDCSGDLCFRNRSFDAAPLTTELAICFKPATAEIGGRTLTGFSYWYEYQGEVAIHRLLDRATWELGGNLDDVNLVCRNWLTPPRMNVGLDTTYSTVGLDRWATLLPGNMWARWSLLPGFDFQYGASGMLVGWYDAVSLVRTTIESNAGEDAIRFNDFHWFEQSGPGLHQSQDHPLRAGCAGPHGGAQRLDGAAGSRPRHVPRAVRDPGGRTAAAGAALYPLARVSFRSQL